MDQTGYIIIAVLLIIVLVVIFTVSFVLYVKTPAPKGCERSKGPQCENCDQASCQFYRHAEERAAMKAAEASKTEETSERKD